LTSRNLQHFSSCQSPVADCLVLEEPITPQEDKRGDSLKSFKYSTSFTAHKNRNNYASRQFHHNIKLHWDHSDGEALPSLSVANKRANPWKFAALQKLRRYGRAMLIVYWNDLKKLKYQWMHIFYELPLTTIFLNNLNGNRI
jgi:hypothetical protein